MVPLATPWLRLCMAPLAKKAPNPWAKPTVTTSSVQNHKVVEIP